VSAPFHKSGKGRATAQPLSREKAPNKLKIYLPSFAAESLAAQVWENRAEELSTMGTEVTSVAIGDLQRLTRCWNQKTISLAFGGADLPPH